MSAALKLNPLIAKETSSGQIQCLVCCMQVKPKIWTAHVNGKKHRDCVEKLKASALAPKRQSAAPSSAAQPPPKKSRAEPEVVEAPVDDAGSVPNDFFDDDKLNITTPWQRTKDERQPGGAGGGGGGVIDNLPHGFFDDKKKDGRVRETIEMNAHLDDEYARWKQEVSEEQTEEDNKAEKEEMMHVRELELERIDDQMAALRRLNDLEIQKEKRLAAAMERKKRQNEEEVEDGDDEMDVEINWRSKSLF